MVGDVLSGCVAVCLLDEPSFGGCGVFELLFLSFEDVISSGVNDSGVWLSSFKVPAAVCFYSPVLSCTFFALGVISISFSKLLDELDESSFFIAVWFC